MCGERIERGGRLRRRQLRRRVREGAADPEQSGPTKRAALQIQPPVLVRSMAEIDERWKAHGITGLPGGVGARDTAAVPRTDVLTDVAPDDLARDCRAQQLFYGAARLDREVRHAPRGIEDVGLGDGTGRARVDTASAGAALIDAGAVGLELRTGEHLRKEEPGPERRIDEAGVLANPAKARLLGEHTFLHGAVVDARERFDPAAGRLVHP